MSSKEQKHSEPKAGTKPRSPKPAVHDLEVAAKQPIQPAAMSEEAGFNPSSLTASHVLRLQRVSGNRTTAQLLSGTTQRPSKLGESDIVIPHKPTVGGDMKGLLQRRVMDPAAWLTLSTKTYLFGACEYTRSPLLLQIDQALQAYAAVRQVIETGGLAEPLMRQQSENYLDRTLQLLEAIDAWRESKKQAGQVVSKRADNADVLYGQVREEYETLIARALAARPGQQANWSGPGSGFTDPHDGHDPGNFQYLINGLTPGNVRSEEVRADPSLYNQNPGIISASIINQHKNSLWALSGYILQVPAENIFSARNKDQGIVAMKGQGHLDHLAAKFGLRTPAEILEESDVAHHNEVAVIGQNYGDTHDKSAITPIGIYIVQGEVDEQVLKFKQGLKTRAGLPHTVAGKTVYQMKPGLSEEWISNLRRVSEERHIPIVWIRQALHATVGGQPNWVLPNDPTAQVAFSTLTAEQQGAIRADLSPDTPIIE